MPVNTYFQTGTPMGRGSEQDITEDLIIECLQIYGFLLYYIPRKSVKIDDILNEDVLNRFDDAYEIEMYMTNVEGFQGEGSLLSKFGLEIRDTANFVVSKKRWHETVGNTGNVQLTTRPAEGDILYFPLTKAFFDIRRVVTKNPFFQIGKLYVYQLECELLQFSSERFDTGVDEIDQIVANTSLDEVMLGNTQPANSDPQSQNDIFVDQSGVLSFDKENPFGEPHH